MNRLIVWHRRDLRLHDNTALLNAINDADEIVPLFILDDDILLKREDFSPACVNFMLESIQSLAEAYKCSGGQLVLRRGKVLEVLKSVMQETGARGIYFNEDYEPFAKARDNDVKKVFEKSGLDVRAFTDQVCFKPGTILTQQGNPYTIFTPYKKNWLSNSDKISRPLSPPDRISTPSLYSLPIPTADDLGFPLLVKPLVSGGEDVGRQQLRRFVETKLFWR
ncbi:MAG: deoxyribodipyrimidine photo-lyase, partial [Chlorobiales bacterium]|nr:deoxyribodipyrimidine photo-lyase [Chlorobiales bacterium]